MGDTPARRGLRGLLDRLAPPVEHLEAKELQARAQAAGCRPVSEIGDRTRGSVKGTLRTVTLRPRSGTPALEAEVYDGTGVLTVVWLGRRRIPGVTPGRTIVVEGLVTTVDGRRVLYNPRYELGTTVP